MKHLNKVALFGALVAAGLLGGCATITDGPRQRVSIAAANGDKVIATIGGRKVQLPAENVELKRTGEIIYIYNADNPKYMDSSANSGALTTMGVNNRYWLNLFGLSAAVFGALTSVLVDMATGSAYEYTNPHLVVPVYPKN